MKNDLIFSSEMIEKLTSLKKRKQSNEREERSTSLRKKEKEKKNVAERSSLW